MYNSVYIRGATIYWYTGKPQFTLNKYRMAIHFWLYRYTSLPCVTSSQLSSESCKKLSIISFEIAQIQVIFKTGRGKKRGKRDWYNSWHKLTQMLTLSDTISPSWKDWQMLNLYDRHTVYGYYTFSTPPPPPFNRQKLLLVSRKRWRMTIKILAHFESKLKFLLKLLRNRCPCKLTPECLQLQPLVGFFCEITGWM